MFHTLHQPPFYFLASQRWTLKICIGSLSQDFTLLCVRHIEILFYPRLHYKLSIKFKMYWWSTWVMMFSERRSNKRTCQSRWVHYMHKGQTPNHRTDLVWPQARPSRNHWPSWRHQRERRFEKVRVGSFSAHYFLRIKVSVSHFFLVKTFVDGNIKYGVVGEVDCLIMTQ